MKKHKKIHNKNITYDFQKKKMRKDMRKDTRKDITYEFHEKHKKQT